MSAPYLSAHWCTTDVLEVVSGLRPLSVLSTQPAKQHTFEVEPRGFEPPISAVQRRRDTLLGLSGDCKIAANTGTWPFTLFPAFQEICSGCCTGRRGSPGCISPIKRRNYLRRAWCFSSAQAHLTGRTCTTAHVYPPPPHVTAKLHGGEKARRVADP
jgi:hypothetical protein